VKVATTRSNLDGSTGGSVVGGLLLEAGAVQTSACFLRDVSVFQRVVMDASVSGISRSCRRCRFQPPSYFS
jgi:hypothetical protein